MARALFSKVFWKIMLLNESEEMYRAPDLLSVFPLMKLPNTMLFDDLARSIPDPPLRIVLFEIVLY